MCSCCYEMLLLKFATSTASPNYYPPKHYWRCYVRNQMRGMKGSYEVSKSADRRHTDKKEGGEGLGSILIWDPGSSERELGLGWCCSYRSSDAIWRRCHWSPFINALQESMIFTTLWEITTPAVLIADFFVTFVSCKCKNIYHNIKRISKFVKKERRTFYHMLAWMTESSVLLKRAV